MAAPQKPQQQEENMVDDGCMQEELHDSTTQDHSKNRSPSTVASHKSAETAAPPKRSYAHNHLLAADQPLSPYPTSSPYSYYYPGHNGSLGDCYNQGYYIAGNAMDHQYPVVQADDGSFVYLMQGLYPGYDAYTPYVPISTVGVDGQYVGQQVYPTSPPISQPPVAFPGYSLTSLPHGDFVQAPYYFGSSPLVRDGAFGNGYVGGFEVPASKPNFSATSRSGAPQSKSFAMSALNKLKPTNKASPQGPALQSDLPAQGYYAVTKFPVYNQGKSGLLYPNKSVNSKANDKGWYSTEKLKTRSKSNGVSDVNILNEKNLGLGTTNTKSELRSGGDGAESLATDEAGNCNSITSSVPRDQYNLPDFLTKYDHAYFFVIKSYSEDDIHKSIKYNVWASTPNGNKRLNSAYLDAQEKTAESGSKCPVFLFFSVNASGQFCGVAEMIGLVDFNKSMDFWQQNKWNGYFPVKWHIVKDVPNSQLRHIILENNENKPVTNSRDTQEVKFHQGIEMLQIFKNYTSSSTSILDDFDFYENRQKIMQQKKNRQLATPHDSQLQKVDEVTTSFQSVDLSTVKNN
ncbi:hypothetical protein UlMin_025362 [Ulmus minor]